MKPRFSLAPVLPHPLPSIRQQQLLHHPGDAASRPSHPLQRSELRSSSSRQKNLRQLINNCGCCALVQQPRTAMMDLRIDPHHTIPLGAIPPARVNLPPRRRPSQKNIKAKDPPRNSSTTCKCSSPSKLNSWRRFVFCASASTTEAKKSLVVSGALILLGTAKVPP